PPGFPSFFPCSAKRPRRVRHRLHTWLEVPQRPLCPRRGRFRSSEPSRKTADQKPAMWAELRKPAAAPVAGPEARKEKQPLRGKLAGQPRVFQDPAQAYSL